MMGSYPQGAENISTCDFNTIIVTESLEPSLEGCIEVLHEVKEMKRKGTLAEKAT
jgi:hypothetical protein